jgi:hypothetical protein
VVVVDTARQVCTVTTVTLVEMVTLVEAVGLVETVTGDECEDTMLLQHVFDHVFE